jgi:hypothetical protein
MMVNVLGDGVQQSTCGAPNQVLDNIWSFYCLFSLFHSSSLPHPVIDVRTSQLEPPAIVAAKPISCCDWCKETDPATEESRVSLAVERVEGRHIAANGGVLSLKLETIANADLAIIIRTRPERQPVGN